MPITNLTMEADTGKLDNLALLKKLKFFDFATISYDYACRFQRFLHQQVHEKGIGPCIILCQHHPVITIGRTGSQEEIIAGPCELKKRGIKVYQIERGGKTTYHGPGQLTIYPIIELGLFKKDLRAYLCWLEELGIEILKDFNILVHRRESLTGLWVNQKKVVSIGIAVKKWISFHGLSINIKKEDTANFSLIRPCGLDVKMTCAEELKGEEMVIDEVKLKAVNIIRRSLRCLR
jgi:lipoate-protein ligase B